MIVGQKNDTDWGRDSGGICGILTVAMLGVAAAIPFGAWQLGSWLLS